jgi:transketolase
MVEIRLIPQSEFRRVREADIDRFEKHAIVAEMCRANALAAVKQAGSGHLGSTLSAMDVVVWLYDEVMNVTRVGPESPDRDIFYSSKGHDVPGLYTVLHSHGILTDEQLLKLRRHGGLDGHPDVGVRGVEVNSGSLGMGISKGRGFAWAKTHGGHDGRVYVMTGDGELQEGQIYESLQSAAHHGTANLTVIVDHNKIQSDKPVSEILDLGDLVAKFTSFGWHVARIDGHDMAAFDRVLTELAAVTDRPQIVICDTIKGRGVSFMEHPAALEAGGGLYGWHAGAPDDESYAKAHAEVLGRANARLEARGLDSCELADVDAVEKRTAPPALSVLNALGEPVSLVARGKHAEGVSSEYVADAFGEELLAIGRRREDVVVLDADLAADCRTRSFENELPERFIENGIAEQDMVSMAGGLARSGLLPVVNSFAAFLCSRANEQIYNNASEGTKVVYGAHYAGVIPAGPGKSHQSIRDISLLGALPNMEILQPVNAEEARQATRYAIEDASCCVTLRLVIGPSPRAIELPEGYRLEPGRGVTLHEGDDAICIAYGPVMMNEALVAAEIAAEQGFGLRVVNLPWLNRLDAAWLEEALGSSLPLYVMEDHAPVGGLGDRLREALHTGGNLGGRRLDVLGVEGWPACGTPIEALRFHGLDGASVAARILRDAGKVR